MNKKKEPHTCAECSRSMDTDEMSGISHGGTENGGIVPGLRFPEFRDAGEWEVKKLGELVDIKSGVSPSMYNLANVGKYPFLKVEDLNNCGKYQVKSREFSNNTENLIPKMSAIFPKRGAAIHLNKVRINVDDVLMDTNLMAITPNEEIQIEFLYYNLSSNGLSKIADTSTIPQINNKHINPYNVFIPSLPEQQKIADCLSSLDELITVEVQKIDTLKAHKKGLMQQLFPAEGETVPGLRFPEFRDAGEWKVKRLIDVADKKTKWSFIGGPFGSNLKSSDYVADGIRIIQLQNIGDAEFFDDYKIFTSEKKADELLANNIYPGEIILSKMGDPVGRACLIPYKHARYVMCSDGIRLVVNEKAYSKYFIYTLINSIQFRALVEKTATGSTRKRIGLNDLKNLPIVAPKPDEQQKIADCLSSLDELITAETQKLDTLKDHKKGLMQGLFPSADEVGV